MESKIKNEILSTYPKAKPATDGVKMGDVLIGHPKVPPIVMTPAILSAFDLHEFYMVIANVGGGYYADADLDNS